MIAMVNTCQTLIFIGVFFNVQIATAFMQHNSIFFWFGLFYCFTKTSSFGLLVVSLILGIRLDRLNNIINNYSE